MKSLSIAAGALLTTMLATGAAIAAGDCIENAAGQLVCGADAAAVRARIAAEQRLKTPELTVPAAPGSIQQASYDGDASVTGADAVGPTYVNAETSAEVDTHDGGGSSGGGARGSVYSSYGQAAFFRGGYVFESSGSGDYEAPSFGVGYRKLFAEHGRSTFSWEGELVYSRDSDDIVVLGTPLDVTQWGLAGIAALRWQYGLGQVNPFASVGIGPGYFHASVDDGVTEVEDGDITFVYTGRAGVEFNVSDQISLETAYRFLGTSQSGTPAYHSAELGLNYNF